MADGEQLSTVNDFVCKLKYRNTLPELPFDPKLVYAPFPSSCFRNIDFAMRFRQYPFDPNRFVKYKPTSLERTFKYPLLTEPDLGVPLDLIDPDTYKVPSGSTSCGICFCSRFCSLDYTTSGRCVD
jgi:RNA polymerase II-associated factor 1